jgi:hypothetical protein
MVAYVYLIEEQCHDGEVSGPWTKIGYSQNPPEWRMDANLKRGNPRNIRVAAAFEFPTNEGARAAERNAHAQFAAREHQKEWFRVPWAEIAAWMEASGATPRRATTDESV